MSAKDLTSEMLKEGASKANLAASSKAKQKSKSSEMPGNLESKEKLVETPADSIAIAANADETLIQMESEADLASSALSNFLSSVSMGGLEVMAKVAGEAQPQLAPPTAKVFSKLIEGDVEVVVPVSNASNESKILSSVYVFDGSQELAGKLSYGQKRGIITAYLRGLEVGFVEQNLVPFLNWFRTFRFADAVLKPEDVRNKVWSFRHILLSPKCVHNVSFGSAPKKFYTCARSFYDGIFHDSPSMNEQIERAMNQDITILILGLRTGKKDPIPKSLSLCSDSLITVSAVTFQIHHDPNDAGVVSVFLSLLGVAHHLTDHPPSISSWRRNGLGLFMLVQVIKRCASVNNVKAIDVFLQCSEPSAFHFYTMIGFRRLNKKETDDGFDMLPTHLQAALKIQKPSSFLRFSGLIPPTAVGSSKAPILMQLRHGELRHITNAKSNDENEVAMEGMEIAPRTLPDWCQYPPPRLIGGGRLVYEKKDFENLFVSLPLMRKLFPSPLNPLLPADSLKLKGEMTLAHRKQHSKDKGTKWLSTGEVNLMLSILLCDGRYEDAAFILPVHFGNTLKLGFAAHACYKALLQLEKDNASLDDSEREALIRTILKSDSKEIRSTQQVQQDFVVKEIIEKNPGLLSKKVLVFPQNEDGEHWSVTFVFNPSFIRDNVETVEETDISSKPCFFRYCSINPLGTRKVSIDSGIIWFLNLCFSNEIHQESQPVPNAAMKWCSPFGKSFQGQMLGTKSFPALRLPGENLLPKQDDGWNCGVGVIAAIGIVLRNVCSQKVERITFDDQFGSQKKWELHEDEKTKECFAYFDKQFFEPLPTKKDDLILADYLTMLRLEWFVVFDRMAALHFEVISKRINKKNSVNPLYTETKPYTLVWPNYDTMKKRQTMSKRKLRALAQQLKDEEKAKRLPVAASSLAAGSSTVSAIGVTQSPEDNAAIDLSSPEKIADITKDPDQNATIDLRSPELQSMVKLTLNAGANEIKQTSPKTELLQGLTLISDAKTNNDFHADDPQSESEKANDDTPVNTTTPLKSIAPNSTVAHNDLEDTPIQDDKQIVEEPGYTIKKIEDPSKLLPVKIHIRTPTKKRKGGDLLKRLQLDDILFEDDEIPRKPKKGKLKDDYDDDHGNYIMLSEEAKRQKVSTQSTSTIEAFYRKYHATPNTDDTIVTIDKAFKEELKKFLAESFEKWNWSSEKDYQKTIEDWAKLMKARDCSDTKKGYIRELIKGIKNERAQFTKELTNEFMFTRLTMVKGIRFVKANNSFYARLVYREPDATDSTKMVVAEEELRVEEEWVRSEYADVDIQHIINMHQTDQWTDVPRDVEVRIAKHKIVRVRYVPPQVRHVHDYEAMAKVISEKDVTNAKRRKKLGFKDLPPARIEKLTLLDQTIPRHRISKKNPPHTPSKVARKPMMGALDAKELEKKRLEKEEAKWQKSIIRKPVTSNEKWLGRMENNKETNLEEDFVTMAFGEAFVKELKLGDLRGFVDVPVGDYKPSHLHNHPNLQCVGAPKVHFNQTDGKDLCVSKSLASALFAIGFNKEASIIDNFGEEILRGAVVDALENVVKHARSILPSWIVIRRLPLQYDWKDGLDSRHLLLGVLAASDGSCCHAVCIHGGYVYDANEVHALPLCDEALNYCTSTPLVKSEFVNFRRGYMFRYEGQRKQKLAKMTLKTEMN